MAIGLVGCAATPSLRVAAAGDLQLGATLAASPLAEPLLLAGDVRLVNLEGPLTARSAGASDGNGAGDGDRFRFAPARAGWLRDRVDVASLANNHALDQGAAGRDDSVRALAAAGVAAAYEGHDAVVVRRGRHVTIVARAFAPNASLDDAAADALVAAVAHAARPTLVSLHWGHTGLYVPDPAQRRLAARLVDAGASAVLGHGPHTLQGIERRGHAIIAYSLGNFAFGCACTDVADAVVLEFVLDGGGAARDVTLTPLVAGLGRPPARAHDAGLTALIVELSHDLGSELVVDGDRLRLR
jgi:poly-gamma-glutamate capsule biosynthesis protein CapA/YwtB (metallophosphatase superfamily)